jgi:hypothetical protein
MTGWAHFEAAAPELAANGRALIERFRFVLAGTIRRDGTPRISPVEAHLVRGHLMLVMITGTLKARDLLRDPRIVVNSPVTDPDDPNVIEYKLRGRVVEVEEKALREATAAAIEAESGWRPPLSWHFFSVEVEDAARIAWKDGVMRMSRWTQDRGLEDVTRPVAVIDEPGG